MSTTTERIPLAAGRRIAQSVMGSLQASCERIAIVGSVRRGKATVHDVEVLCIPRTVEVVETDLFDNKYRHLDRPQAWHEAFRGWELVSGNPGIGKLITVEVQGVRVEVHCTTADCWGYMSVIWTGPADFSKRMVGRAKKLGLNPEGGVIYRGPIRQNVAEEADFFALVGIPFQHPYQRQ